MGNSRTLNVTLPSEDVTLQFRARLLQWYRAFGRHDLPWQQPNNPYYCWLSEIMLQQTQVQSVRGYFLRFIEQFPTLEKLANAPLDEVLSLWSGLGYYARARNLHATAKIIMSRHGGQFPAELDALIDLPGIGLSTAAAIRSQAFNLPAAILDGNVKRVLARFAALDTPTNYVGGVKQFWAWAEHLADPLHPAHYTQAIMDLGALLCTRTKPDCPTCPLKQYCAAYQTGTVHLYPVKVKKKPVPETSTYFSVFFDMHQKKLLLYRRPVVGLWGGLWSLPETDTPPESGHLFFQKQHRFTHFLLSYAAYHLPKKQGFSIKALKGLDTAWFSLEEALKLGIPKPIRDILIAHRNQGNHENHILPKTKERSGIT